MKDFVARTIFLPYLSNPVQGGAQMKLFVNIVDWVMTPIAIIPDNLIYVTLFVERYQVTLSH